MKIIIDISEDIYKKCQTSEFARKSIYFDLVDAIRRSTILPKGKWIKQYQNVNGTDFEVQNKVCSECNKSVKYKYPFCPWCGADMRGDE